MKKSLKFAIVALAGLLAFALGGCIPSLHPIYTADKLVEIKSLPGIWKKAEDSGNDGNYKVSFKNTDGQPETWDFRHKEGKSYRLVHEDSDGLKAAFEVHIIRLGAYYFMDFYPTELDKESDPDVAMVYKMNSMEANHLLPVHTFAKLEVSATELRISMFDPDFLKNLLERQQIRIKHEKTDSGYVLTASPEDLQKFALKYANNKEAFLDEPVVLQNKL